MVPWRGELWLLGECVKQANYSPELWDSFYEEGTEEV